MEINEVNSMSKLHLFLEDKVRLLYAGKSNDNHIDNREIITADSIYIEKDAAVQEITGDVEDISVIEEIFLKEEEFEEEEFVDMGQETETFPIENVFVQEESEDNTNNSHTTVNPGAPWKHEAIVLLAETFRAYQHMLLDSSVKKNMKNPIFTKIAVRMQKGGFPVTRDQCYKKWQKLRYRYQKIKDSKKLSERETTRQWVYFSLLDDIMRSRDPAADPIATSTADPIATPADSIATPAADSIATPAADPIATPAADPIATPAADHIATPADPPTRKLSKKLGTENYLQPVTSQVGGQQIRPIPVPPATATSPPSSLATITTSPQSASLATTTIPPYASLATTTIPPYASVAATTISLSTFLPTPTNLPSTFPSTSTNQPSTYPPPTTSHPSTLPPTSTNHPSTFPPQTTNQPSTFALTISSASSSPLPALKAPSQKKKKRKRSEIEPEIDNTLNDHNSRLDQTVDTSRDRNTVFDHTMTMFLQQQHQSQDLWFRMQQDQQNRWFQMQEAQFSRMVQMQMQQHRQNFNLQSQMMALMQSNAEQQSSILNLLQQTICSQTQQRPSS